MQRDDAVGGDFPPCYVIGGALSIFTENLTDASDLSWIDDMIQVDLEKAINRGALDTVDPAISIIQYIPPGTDFSNSEAEYVEIEGAPTNNETGNSQISSAPAWSWIIASFSLVGLAASVVLFTVYRKRRSLHDSIGSDIYRSPAKDSRRASLAEIIDDNSEFDDDEIYEDNEDSPSMEISKAVTWSKVQESQAGKTEELSRLQINADDPTQPVIQPVLDEEAETFIDNDGRLQV